MALGIRMKTRGAKYFVAAEALLCFGLPTYFLFWGVLTLPLWLLGAGRGATYALIHALTVIGGCAGLIALVITIRYVVGPESEFMPWYAVIPLTIVGIVSIWATMTGQFSGFELNWFSVPTLCAIHLLWLAVRKRRNGPPNKPMHATCETHARDG
jgi:hypothetical protein